MSEIKSLGDRIKDAENVFRYKLPERLPVLIRLDGKGFSKFTKNFEKPFDTNFMELMDKTAKYLCENIQGVQIAYVGSDEITLLIHNYKQLNSQSWFNNEIQKMCSISAGMASSYFSLNTGRFAYENGSKLQMVVFDSRVFVVPESEVNNSFLFRQRDIMRNSISMFARSLYSHKELLNKNSTELKEMCKQKGVDLDTKEKYFLNGRSLEKREVMKDGVFRTKWDVNKEIPIFSEDPDYINKFLKPAEKQP